MSNYTLVGRLFIVFAVLVLALPGVMAATSSLGGGSAASGSGSSSGNVVSTPGLTTGSAVATMTSINADHWVADTSGKKVEVTLNVPHADSILYNFKLTPNKDGQTVATQASLTATQTFTVTNAINGQYSNPIMANVHAENGEGDVSNTYLSSYNYNDPTGITLTGVTQTAVATNTYAQTSESIKAATSGYELWTYTQANNKKNYYAESGYETWNGPLSSLKGLSLTSSAQKSSVVSTGSVGSVTVPTGCEMELWTNAWNQMQGADRYSEIYNQPKAKTLTNVAMSSSATGTYANAVIR